MKNEPLVTAATIVSAVTAVLALLVAFGVPVTQEQQVAILGVVAVLAPLIVAALARPKVTPHSNVLEYQDPTTGYVVAGPANEAVEAGDVIRDGGSLADDYADDDYTPEHLVDTEGDV